MLYTINDYLNLTSKIKDGVISECFRLRTIFFLIGYNNLSSRIGLTKYKVNIGNEIFEVLLHLLNLVL